MTEEALDKQKLEFDPTKEAMIDHAAEMLVRAFTYTHIDKKKDLRDETRFVMPKSIPAGIFAEVRDAALNVLINAKVPINTGNVR